MPKLEADIAKQEVLRFLFTVFPGAKKDLRAAYTRCDLKLSCVLLEKPSGKTEPKHEYTCVSLEVADKDSIFSDSTYKAVGALLAYRAALPSPAERPDELPLGDGTGVYISYIGTARWRRNRGLGQQLLRHAVDAFADRDGTGDPPLTKAWLETRTLDKSHSLYTRCGFKESFKIEGLYGEGPWGEATVYIRDL